MSTVTASEIEVQQIEEQGIGQQPQGTINPSAPEARINCGNVELMRAHVCCIIYEQEGNSLSDLRRLTMLNDPDNYIIVGTYVIASHMSHGDSY